MQLSAVTDGNVIRIGDLVFNGAGVAGSPCDAAAKDAAAASCCC
jgi:hypothetical protein